mgnify:CR=1 FL=1
MPAYGLLVREARLDRLLGDPDLRREHALDPSGFRSEFEDYIATVAPKHANTPDEAQAFRDYMDLLG